MQAHNISRLSKLNNRSSREIQIVITFHGGQIQAYNISRRSKLNKKSSREIQNGHNFSHEGPIQAHNISRFSKLNNGGSRENQMVITFHTEVRFRRIIYRQTRH